MINVLIVDDERIVQDAFISYVNSASERYSVYATTKDAGNADIYCASGKIDLVLMDICTANEQSGLSAAKRIKKDYPHIKVIIVTSAPDYRFIEMAKEAKADSFWYKETSEEALLDVMNRTMEGEHIYPNETLEVQVGLAKSSEFTAKECELMALLLQNYSLREIANQMGVEYTTVRTHVKNIKEKTGAKDLVGICYLVTKSRAILPEY